MTQTGTTAKDAPTPALVQDLTAAGLIPDGSVWTRLRGGRSNRVWSVSAGGDTRVVKLFPTSSDNPLFPNDPAAERAALNHLAGSDIAPRLVGSCDTGAGPVVVYDMVGGPCWQGDVGAAARLLRRLHGLPAMADTRAAPNGSRALRDQTRAIIARTAPGKDAEGLAALEPAGPSVPALNRTAFLHGDPVAGNMIQTVSGLILIDWQCPASGDPCEDLSVFLSPAMQILYRGAELGAEQTTQFLDAYGDDTVARRYRALAPWYHWRMAAYCLWRGLADPSNRAAFDAECAALRLSSRPD